MIARRTALLSCVLGAALAAAVAAAPGPLLPHGLTTVMISGTDPDTAAGAAHEASAATPVAQTGYTLESMVTGFTPGGFDVWIDKGAANHASIAVHAKQAVVALDKLGLPVRWRGYGKPADGPGRIVITEGTTTGCVTGTMVAATTTWSAALMLPVMKAYIVQSHMSVCQPMYNSQPETVRQAVLFHEMGHAMGLDHTNYIFQGHRQIMNKTASASVTTYQSGDVAGLRKLLSGEPAITKYLTGS